MGRKTIGKKPMTPAERQRRRRKHLKPYSSNAEIIHRPTAAHHEKRSLAMSTVARIAAAAAAGAVLAACAAGGTVVLPVYVGSYDPGMLNYAASKGGMVTEVVGNPFDVPKEEVERAAVNSMTGSHFGPKVVFTTKASPDNPSPYRVVMLFDPAPNAQAHRLCSDPNQPSAAQPGRLRLMVAFCSSDTVITSTAGWISKPQRPTHPTFRSLIRQITVVLFPLRDPDQDCSSTNTACD